MKELMRRIQNLEVAAKALEAKKKAHEPFVLYRPWNITLDEFYVIYYPEGLFKAPQKHGPVSYSEACELLKGYPRNLDLQVSMSECAEWLFAFHHYSEHSKLYTQEQLERFKAQELADNPELEYMTTEAGAEMLRIMLKLPQHFMTSMAAMQATINRNGG